MRRRQSQRLKKKQKVNYVDNSDSDSEKDSVDSDSTSNLDSDEDDDDDDDDVPSEIIDAIHDAIQSAIQSVRPDTSYIATSGQTNRKKRRRGVRTVNTPPPIQPTDLVSLIKLCRLCEKTIYRDCDVLFELLPCLVELNELVGLEKIKQSIVDFVLLMVQRRDILIPNMRHLIIAGPPGCGKTTVATIIGKILSVLEGSTTPHIVYGTQSNMIGGFLGQTAPKTEAVIRSAFGGVLIIDEASSLADGRSDQNSDSFSKSCIDTLNRMLSEHGDKFICILAGYKREIYRDILSINPGMERRFSTCFEIGEYSVMDIKQILMKTLTNRKVQFSDGVDIPTGWIKEHKSKLKNTGGDCNIIVDYIMTGHARRMFGQTNKNRITQEDINNGLEKMSERLRMKSSSEDIPTSLMHMFT